MSSLPRSLLKLLIVLDQLTACECSRLPSLLTASKERRLYSQASQLRTGKLFSIHPIPPTPKTK